VIDTLLLLLLLLLLLYVWQKICSIAGLREDVRARKASFSSFVSSACSSLGTECRRYRSK
jgi:hypothetical protein